MVEKNQEEISQLFDLSEDQIRKLFHVIKKLWTEGHLVIEIVKNFDWFSSTFRSAVKKHSIEGIEQKDLSHYITVVLKVIEEIGQKSDADDVTTKGLNIKESDEKKLQFLVDLIDKFELTPEIDYRIHTVTPHIEIRNIMFNRKSYFTAHRKGTCPTTSIRFPVNTSGEKTSFTCEFSETELNQFIKSLTEAKEDLIKLKKDIGSLKV